MTDLKKIIEDRFLLQEEYLGTNKLVNKINPKLSVFTITYQQALYIRECIESVLMQKTNFPIEYIIGDDGSTDGTTEICKEYADKYPDKIRLFVRDRKLSQYIDKNGAIMRFNANWCQMSCRGEYIAICEGDDYWIDPLKLQKQVEILDKYQNYCLVFTSFKKYNQPTNAFIPLQSLFLSGWIYDELMKETCCVLTVTICYRRSLIIDLPVLDGDYFSGDSFLYFHLASKKQFYFLEDVTSVYRILKCSASHFIDRRAAIHFRFTVSNMKLYMLDLHPMRDKDAERSVRVKSCKSILKHSLLSHKQLIKNGDFLTLFFKFDKCFFSSLFLLMADNKFFFYIFSYIYRILFSLKNKLSIVKNSAKLKI